mgnify:FL=1
MNQLDSYRDVIDKLLLMKRLYGWSRSFTDEEIRYVYTNKSIGRYTTYEDGNSEIQLEDRITENGAEGSSLRKDLMDSIGLQLYTEKSLPPGSYHTKAGDRLYRSNMVRGLYYIDPDNKVRSVGYTLRWENITDEVIFDKRSIRYWIKDSKRNEHKKKVINTLANVAKLNMALGIDYEAGNYGVINRNLCYESEFKLSRLLQPLMNMTEEELNEAVTDPESKHAEIIIALGYVAALNDIPSWRHGNIPQILQNGYKRSEIEDYIIWTP